MKKIFLITAILMLCLAACSPALTVNPQVVTATPKDVEMSPTPSIFSHPFPNHTAYAPGSILPNHRTQTQLDDDVRAFYDYWKAAYLIQVGTDANGHPFYRIAFGKDAEAQANTVSEGQGFGMLILPVMAGYDPEAQEIFDGLWLFARTHPSEVDARLMDWNIVEAEGNDSAFDGDADIALGLLLADAQWGSQGEINYKAEANTLIAGILESTIGPESRLPMLGDWVDAHGEEHNQYTPRSSDFMLVNFRAYGKATGDPVWDEVVTNSLKVITNLQETYSPKTGLLPDFIVMSGEEHSPAPAPAGFLEGENDGNFSYNAGRDPWRLGADALLNNDAASRAAAQKMSVWAESTSGGEPTAFHAGYDLEGNPLEGSDYFTTFFVAPMGVAAMTSPDQQVWLNLVYDVVYQTHEDYYEDTVTLLCLITMTGNAWMP
ncbi:MAG TPA: beta-glucanase [Anaerolineaceae bacterium]|nr:beta-glucanase [Anaerolineaceae bacterium]